MSFKKVAIANRGEVAVRIIRACREMGIRTVLLHSEADVASIAYREADETFCVGPALTAESYLNIESNVNGAKAAGAEAIHPGFGFLSENADFAQACADNGIVFIGPSPESIRLLGDKIASKKLVTEAGVPTVPGYEGDDQSVETLRAKAKEIGYPVIVKATAGGGGRGMKIITNDEEAEDQILSAQREGLSAFGSDKVFLEKYLNNAKHIEFQVFGDAKGSVFHLFERECSVQRRHQKIIEEALSPSLDEELREKMAKAAISVAEASKYLGAGTVEFLLQDGEFYFLEMNTRLQVEHPVTEEILGVDLVKAQIRTAQGEATGWRQEKLHPNGHSIECRIYAEDSYKRLPSTGQLGTSIWPSGRGRRYEVGFESGDQITAFYDPMIAKVIVFDENRKRAIEKMLQVLSETVIFGVKTNIPYLRAILKHPEFVSGVMTTKFIEKNFSEALEEPELPEEIKAMAKKSSGPKLAGQQKNPWNQPWRLV